MNHDAVVGDVVKNAGIAGDAAEVGAYTRPLFSSTCAFLTQITP